MGDVNGVALDRAAARDAELDVERLRGRLAELLPDVAAEPSAIRVVRAPGRVSLVGERVAIQWGTSLAHPPNSIGAHVSAVTTTTWGG